MQFPPFFGITDINTLLDKKYNQDLLDIRSWWNDHDNAKRIWTSLSANGLNMNSNKITGLANGTASTDAAAYGQIKYIQAVQSTTQTQTSTTSSTFTAATNQSVTITPTSSSNRVKVTVSTFVVTATIGTGVALTIKRGSTELSGATIGFWFTDLLGGNTIGSGFSYIDSPATTSATTYQVFFKNLDNTHTVSCGGGNGLSVIVAEEIV